MMTVEAIDIIKLLPEFMRDDDAIKGLADGVNPTLSELGKSLKLLRTWDQIDNLSEAELDELAWELSVDWYDTAADVATKRELIKTSRLIHSRRGTKWAVEQLISLFFQNGIIQEWFEVGGDPYTFAVTTTDPTATSERADAFIRAVNKAKNARSHLISITQEQAAEMAQYVAVALQEAEIQTITIGGL